MRAPHLVFVDKTWATTNMTRRYGRAPGGTRCVGRVPAARRHTSTFVCALRADGLAAPLVLAGACVRYLPPYSPDLNPIEQVFAKLKALLRKTAARSVEALWTAMGQLLDAFDPAECARYLRHCGYA